MQTIKVTDIYQGVIKINVPDWVRWMATDQSGSLWFYALKTTVSINHTAWTNDFGAAIRAASIRPPKDYKQELYTWS